MTVALEVLIIVCAAVGITLNVGNIINMTQTEKDNISRSIMSQLESQLDNDFFEKLKKKLFSFGILANAAITTAIVPGANGIKEQTQPISLTMDNDLVNDMKQVASGISGNTIQIKVETIESVRSAENLYNAFLTNNLIEAEKIDLFKTYIENYYNKCVENNTLNFICWNGHQTFGVGNERIVFYYLLATNGIYEKDFYIDFKSDESNGAYSYIVIENGFLLNITAPSEGVGWLRTYNDVNFPIISDISNGLKYNNYIQHANVVNNVRFYWGNIASNKPSIINFLIKQDYNVSKNVTSNYKDTYDVVGATNIVDGATKTGDLSLTIANLNDTIAKLGTTTDVVGELADTMQVAIYDKTTEKDIAVDVPISDTIKEFESNIPIIVHRPNIPEYEFGSSVDSLFTMYHVTVSTELKSLANYLWDTNLISQIEKWFTNPMNFLVSLQAFPIAPNHGDRASVKLGSIELPISMYKLSSQFITFDCGSINVPKKYYNFLDLYNTSVNIYLPFIGIVSLNANEVMGSKLNVYYNIDFLSGSCVCNVRMIKNNMNNIIYTGSGNMSANLPLSSLDYSSFYGAIGGLATNVGMGAIVGGIQGAVSGAVSGLVSNALNVQQKVQNGGNISGNASLINYKTPFLIINRPIPMIPNNYGHSVGYVDNNYRRIGDCSGFCTFANVDLSGFDCTEDEKDGLIQLLNDGIII